MSVQISRSCLQKLTHESVEIRLRAFDQISGKFRRAIAFKSTIEFKPSELCKQLIRWFGFQPVPKPKDALELLLELLTSEYSEYTLDKIGCDRVLHELSKIQILLRHNEEADAILEKILIRVRDYQKQKNVDGVIKGMSSLNQNVDKSSTSCDTSVNSKDVQSWENISLLSKCNEEDFEVNMMQVSSLDFNILKSYQQILAEPTVKRYDVEQTLHHISITIYDYPFEFFLQPPYTFIYMIDMFKDAGKSNRPDISVFASTFTAFLSNVEHSLHSKYCCTGFVPYKAEKTEKKTQLKLIKAMVLLLDVILMQLDNIRTTLNKDFFSLLELMYKILKIYKIMKFKHEFRHLKFLKDIAWHLHSSANNQDNAIIDRIKYLVLMHLLQLMVENNLFIETSFNELNLLKPLLWDYPYRKNFEKNYIKLEKLFCCTNSSFADTLNKFKELEQSLIVSIKYLSNDIKLNYKELQNFGYVLSDGAKKLESLKLLEIILQSVVESYCLLSSNPEVQVHILNILKKLMIIECQPTKLFVFNKILLSTKKHLTCIMNQSQYANGVTNKQLLEANILGIPWDEELMKLVIYNGFGNESQEIQTVSENIVLVILNSRHLLKEKWFNFFNMFLPFLPLLISHSNKFIVELLLETFNPDDKEFSFHQKLVGNITCLYHKNNVVRNEALARILYMLQSMPYADEYVPNIKEIRDIIPSNLFVQHMPKKLEYIFNMNENSVPNSTIDGFLEILSIPDVEPLIRKSTLLQLNSVCQNVTTLEVFCSKCAYYLILQVIENSMKKTTFKDYKESIIPALGILNKSLFLDSKLRTEMQNVPNIYMVLLRAVFFFINDIQIRQDAAICLFLLIFEDFVDIDLTNSTVYIPNIIKSLIIPFHCEFKDVSRIAVDQVDRKQSFYLEIFENEENFNSYVRHLVADCFSNNYFKINRKYLETQLTLDVCSAYMLTENDIVLLKNTVSAANLKVFMHGMQNATNHESLIKASFLLQLQIYLDKDISEEYIVEIFKSVNKFLQLSPADDVDFSIYSDLLGMIMLCIRSDYKTFIYNMSKALTSDSQHSLISLLQNEKVPLDLFYRVAKTMKGLLVSPHGFIETTQTGSVPKIFYTNLFELYYELSINLFQQRDLDRCRCVLPLLSTLSKNRLALTDTSLMKYTVGLIKLSFALKNLSHTGAAWQKNCLETVCFLYQQISDAKVTLKVNMKTLKYISGLCSHGDTQVRALAWTILLIISRFHLCDDNALKEFLETLSFLPGGFLACCLSTFVDHTEIVICRQISGLIFSLIFTKVFSAEESMKILMEHNFFREIEIMMSTIWFQRNFPLNFDFASKKVLTPSELIIHVCRILFQLCVQNPNAVNELCRKSFVTKMYELLKVPNAFDYPMGYIMCVEICKLYTFFNYKTSDVIQKSMCRDKIWINRYVDLLAVASNTDVQLNNVLQMTALIATNDNVSYQHLCEAFDRNPNSLFNVLSRGLHLKCFEMQLQLSVLQILNMLVIKSQDVIDMYLKSESDEDVFTFINVMDKTLDEDVFLSSSSRTNNEMSEQDNDCNTPVSQFSMRSYYENYNAKGVNKITKFDSIGGFCALELCTLFNYVYPTSNIKFKSHPTSIQLQVCYTLGVVLKFSKKARETVKNLKLLDKIIKIINNFFEELNMSCTTFIRRYGDAKKAPILKNLLVLVNLISNWHSSPMEILIDEEQSRQISSIVYKMWPWMNHSTELKLYTLQMCALIGERSIVMSKSLANQILSNAQSVLQLVIKYVMTESTAKHINENHHYPIVIGIRILINSCSCAEGRMTLLKARVFDVFDSMQSFNSKLAKFKHEVLNAWLEFWEIFSRYAEGAIIRNINTLCMVIDKTQPNSESRLCALRIVRNMSFLAQNKGLIFTNADIISIMDTILDVPLREGHHMDSYEEQAIICVTIWKLITLGSKYISNLKGTKLIKKFKLLYEHLNALKTADLKGFVNIPFASNVLNILDIIVNIFNNKN